MNTKAKLFLRATMLLLSVVFSTSLSRSQTQDQLEPLDTITVSTSAARIGISLPGRAIHSQSLRWAVLHDGKSAGAMQVDAPGDNPLALVIVLDLNSHASGRAVSEVRANLEELPSRLHLKTAPRVVVAAPESARLSVKWPRSWPTLYADSPDRAYSSALDFIEHSPGVRRALLIITDRIGEIPAHAFEDADARLSQTGALIYLMTVQSQHLKYGDPSRVIARSNLRCESLSLTTAEESVTGAQFKHFTKVANSMYVVSYPLAESAALPGNHTGEVRIFAGSDVLASQSRTFTVH